MEKVWLVTGSARGLGRSIAEAIIDAGHHLVATARKPGELADLVARGGDRVRAVALDVTDEAAAHAAISAAVEAFGRLDVVVNNAGYANVGSFEDLPSDDFRRQVETDFFGVVNVTRAAVPVMRKQRSGHIVQISSVGGRVGTPGLSAYQASKWAVGGLTEVLAAELGPLGVKVTCVEPGGMRTDWAGASMTVYETKPDYAATVGAFTTHARHNQDMGRSDPKRCAQALLELVAMDRPPVHLLLGSDAMFMAELALSRRSAEDRANAALSESTDYPGQPRFADTPIARYLKDHAD